MLGLFFGLAKCGICSQIHYGVVVDEATRPGCFLVWWKAGSVARSTTGGGWRKGLLVDANESTALDVTESVSYALTLCETV